MRTYVKKGYACCRMGKPVASLNLDFPTLQGHMGWSFGYLTKPFIGEELQSAPALEPLHWLPERGVWGCENPCALSLTDFLACSGCCVLAGAEEGGDWDGAQNELKRRGTARKAPREGHLFAGSDLTNSLSRETKQHLMLRIRLQWSLTDTSLGKKQQSSGKPISPLPPPLRTAVGSCEPFSMRTTSVYFCTEFEEASVLYRLSPVPLPPHVAFVPLYNL